MPVAGAADGTLHTARLALEPLSVAHANDAIPVFADAGTFRYMPGTPRTDAATLRDYFARLAGGSGRDDERWLNWLAFTRGARQCVGWMQATAMPHEASIAYVVAAAHRGRGYAREAAAAVVARLWHSPSLAVIVAQADVRNVASQRVAEALGFVRDPGDVESELRGEPTRDVVYRLRRPAS